MALSLHEVLAKFPPAVQHGRNYRTTCPAHDDHNPSLDIAEGKNGSILFFCRSHHCPVSAILAAAGLTPEDVGGTQRRVPHSRWREPSAIYVYTTRNGAPLYEALRFDRGSKKTFKLRRPIPTGGYVWNMDGVDRVPYRLDQLDPSTPVWIVEGEKDVDRLWTEGVQATCNTGGAKKWTARESRVLAEIGVRDTILIPDNDPEGRAHVALAVLHLHAAGLTTLALMPLPGVGPKGDVSDWFNQGHTVAELDALAQHARTAATPLQLQGSEQPPVDAYPPSIVTTILAAPFSEDGPDHLTDAGAATRFARECGDVVRYDHRRQYWLMWHGHRWLADVDVAVVRLVRHFARAWQHDAIVEIPDYDRRSATVKFALRLEQQASVNSMLFFAKAFHPITDPGTQWDLDPWLLGVSNGVVDLRTGQLRPGGPDDRITMNTSVPYDPEAQCPRWTRFITEIFADHSDLIDFVARAIGYSITGITSEQALFLLYGTGSNGKGTLVNTLQRVLGEYAWNMPFATMEYHDRPGIPNDIAALVNRRFVIASETNDGTRLNESRVKALTGCDPITARFLHGEFFMFNPIAKFWLSVNHKPIVRDDSHGFWRRMRLIPFVQRFAIDPTLSDALMAEAPGILAWCIRGCLAWQRDGLQAPAIITEATEEYERDSDQFGAFLLEDCDETDDEAEIGGADFYQYYDRWRLRNGYTDRERLSATMFGRKVAQKFRKKRTEAGIVIFGVRKRF